MMRFGKYWRDLGVAFDNLGRILTTPRELLADELTAIEFCTKMRALGTTGDEGLQIAAMMVAAGCTLDEAQVFMKMSAKRMVTNEDLYRLSFNHGYRINMGRANAEH